MARQRVHNRRAGRGSSGGGASWISYSDMMAALLLVFVLILCMSLYQYFTMLDSKTQELDAQATLLAQQQADLDSANAALATQQKTLDTQSATLLAQQATLDDQAAQLASHQLTLAPHQQKLDQQTATLATQQSALDDSHQALASKEIELFNMSAQLSQQQATLDAQEAKLSQQQEKLDQQQAAIDAQTKKIDDLVGVRTQIITDLSSALRSARLRATVDPNTGDIVLDSAVFIESGKDTNKPEGRALLDRYIPVYLSVLLSPDYSGYLGEIIIEGHTDTVGDYFMNLELSQSRALTVAQYCLQMPTLTETQRTMLRTILTATGRSYSDPVYYADGSVNLDASRRVEFKFSLRDAEMIDEMNRILQGQ